LTVSSLILHLLPVIGEKDLSVIGRRCPAIGLRAHWNRRWRELTGAV